MSRRAPSYSPIVRDRSMIRSRPEQLGQRGPWRGSGSPQPSHTGGVIGRMALQQRLQTQLRSGSSRMASQAAQAGARRAESRASATPGIRGWGWEIGSCVMRHEEAWRVPARNPWIWDWKLRMCAETTTRRMAGRAEPPTLSASSGPAAPVRPPQSARRFPTTVRANRTRATPG